MNNVSTNHTSNMHYEPTNRWVAQFLRKIAERLDPPATIAPPTPAGVAREKLTAAQFELLDAEAERERWIYTCHMLNDRVARLQRVAEGAALGVSLENHHDESHTVAALPARTHRRST